MFGSLGWSDLPGHSVLGILVVLGYPVLALAALETARALGQGREFASSILGQIAYLVLPTGAIWLILAVLAELPPENWAGRSAETAFALTGLYVLLRLAQAALMTFIDESTRAPKLLLDVLRIGLSLVWGAAIVSSIWAVDLRSLLAAMGVGSIVLGFALQEFLSNLLAGLGLLWAHKFGIGDWIVVICAFRPSTAASSNRMTPPHRGWSRPECTDSNSGRLRSSLMLRVWASRLMLRLWHPGPNGAFFPIYTTPPWPARKLTRRAASP